MKNRLPFAALVSAPWFLFALYVAISHKAYQFALARKGVK